MASVSSRPARQRRFGYVLAAFCGVAIGTVCTVIVASRPPSPPGLPGSPGAALAAERLVPAADRSADSAVRAATVWVLSGRVLMATDPLAAEKTVRAMATAADADRLATEALATLRQLRETLAGGTGPVILHQAVLATRTAAIEDHRARIELWNVSVLARQGIAPPQSSWSISSVDLVWEREGWRVAGVRTTPGPAPILSDAAVPSTALQLADALDGFAGDGMPR